MALLGTDMKSSLRIASSKLDNVKNSGAHAMVTACPVCHMMFDGNQSMINKIWREPSSADSSSYSAAGTRRRFGLKMLGCTRIRRTRMGSVISSPEKMQNPPHKTLRYFGSSTCGWWRRRRHSAALDLANSGLKSIWLRKNRQSGEKWPSWIKRSHQ